MQNDCLEFGYISVNSFKQLVFEKYPSYKLDNFKFYLAKDFYNFKRNKKKISISEYVSNLDDCEKEVLIQVLIDNKDMAKVIGKNGKVIKTVNQNDALDELIKEIEKM